MASKKKYYVVWEGVKPGIYDTWTEAKLNISGFPNAKYKSFKTKTEAEIAFSEGLSTFVEESQTSKKSRTKKPPKANSPLIDQRALSVDAACSGNPGIMEYRAVWVKDGTELFKQGPFKWGTNNIGEFLALVHALALFNKKNIDLPIYTDSRTALAWLRKKKVNTKLARKSENKILFELIARAEKWLHNNTYKNTILKWDTKEWGEIPADFGRK